MLRPFPLLMHGTSLLSCEWRGDFLEQDAHALSHLGQDPGEPLEPQLLSHFADITAKRRGLLCPHAIPGNRVIPGPTVQDPVPPSRLQSGGEALGHGQGRLHHPMFVDGDRMTYEGPCVGPPTERLPLLPPGVHELGAVEGSSGEPQGTPRSGGACGDRMWEGHLQTNGRLGSLPVDSRVVQEGAVPAYAKQWQYAESGGVPILPNTIKRSDDVDVVKHFGLGEYSQSTSTAHSLRSTSVECFAHSPRSVGDGPFTADVMDDLDGEAASLLPRDLLVDTADAICASKSLPPAPAVAPYPWHSHFKAGALPCLRPPSLDVAEGQAALALRQGGLGGANTDDEVHLSRSSVVLSQVQPWVVDPIPTEDGLLPLHRMVHPGHQCSGRQQQMQLSHLGCEFQGWSPAHACCWEGNHGWQERDTLSGRQSLPQPVLIPPREEGQEDGALAAHSGFGFATRKGGLLAAAVQKDGAFMRNRGPPPGFPSITSAGGIDALVYHGSAPA